MKFYNTGWIHGHCEYGHYHGNENSEDCPWCNHPDEAYSVLGDPFDLEDEDD